MRTASSPKDGAGSLKPDNEVATLNEERHASPSAREDATNRTMRYGVAKIRDDMWQAHEDSIVDSVFVARGPHHHNHGNQRSVAENRATNTLGSYEGHEQPMLKKRKLEPNESEDESRTQAHKDNYSPTAGRLKGEDNERQQEPGPGATDDDAWLRGKTNRLLDLANGDDSNTDMATTQPAGQAGTIASNDQPEKAPATAPELPVDVESLSSKRLFVRNLPYLASEAELHQIASKYGPCDEVPSPTISSVRFFMMSA